MRECEQDYRGDLHNSPQAFSRYLQDLAARHKSLNHTPEEPHFFRGELEEFYTGFRDRVNFPALIQEGGEVRFTSDNADNAFKERESSFMIVQSYEEDGDYDAVYEAFDLKEFRLDEVTAIPIQNVRERYAGMRYTFTTSAPFWNEIDTRNWRP